MVGIVRRVCGRPGTRPHRSLMGCCSAGRSEVPRVQLHLGPAGLRHAPRRMLAVPWRWYRCREV